MKARFTANWDLSLTEDIEIIEFESRVDPCFEAYIDVVDGSGEPISADHTIEYIIIQRSPLSEVLRIELRSPTAPDATLSEPGFLEFKECGDFTWSFFNDSPPDYPLHLQNSEELSTMELESEEFSLVLDFTEESNTSREFNQESYSNEAGIVAASTYIDI